MTSRSLESVAAGSLVVAVAAIRFGPTIADPDLWGHVRFGQDKIAAGGYIAADSYSFLTHGQTWFNHEWLAEVLMGSVFKGAGVQGLALLKAALALGIVAFLFWWLVHEGMHPIRAAIVMLFGVLALIPTFGTFRPQILTVLLFVILLVLIRGAADPNSSSLWPMPILFAVWINLHGGVLAGLIILSLWAVSFALGMDGSRSWRPTAALAGCLIATGFHPLGFSHIWFLLRTATVARPEITEWRSIDLGAPIGLAYIALVIVLIGSIITSGRKMRISFILPLLAVSAAPLISVRHLQLFVPGLVILGSFYLAPASERFTSSSETSDTVSSTALAIGFTVLLVSSLVTFRAVTSAGDCIALEADQFEFPVRAVRALSEAGMSGNALVPFNWGEFSIWHLGPELQVSVDGRRETIYSERVLRANLDFFAGRGDWDQILDWAPIDVILIPTRSPVRNLMNRDSAWAVEYQDDLATVMVPTESDLVLSVDPSLPIDGSGACFPGA